jgi:integrase
LLKLKERSEDWDNSPVFPVKSIKKAFSTIKKEHGITDLRLHDLRGTGITRMLESGEARHVVKQISGHDTDAAFQHYERKNVESIINAAARLAAHNAKKRKLPLKDAPKPDEKDVTDAEKAA